MIQFKGRLSSEGKVLADSVAGWIERVHQPGRLPSWEGAMALEEPLLFTILGKTCRLDIEGTVSFDVFLTRYNPSTGVVDPRCDNLPASSPGDGQ